MKVLLGVCGGVAAYKAAELVRELQRGGADVQVVMTASAEKFITPLTFAALSGRQVLTSLWTPTTPQTTSIEPTAFDMDHIRVAQEVDIVVIAPATANIIVRLAHGAADDLLSTICLATAAPILLAPAMNVNMWHNAATQHNLATIRSRGIRIVAPGAGYLACGMVGDGRLASPLEIAAAVFAITPSKDLIGETVLITAGGTREPIDPVRFIGNRSSGKMGFALAEAALARGAQVILITTAPAPPSNALHIPVTTAAEMQNAVLAHLHRTSVVIMAAAVADYRILNPSPQKLKKSDTLTLQLTRNDDILHHIVQHRLPGTTVIGFAAETEHVLEQARRKLHAKGIDAIVANDVSQPGIGFESGWNAGTLITHTEEIPLAPSSKREMADRIFNRLSSIRQPQHAHT